MRNLRWILTFVTLAGSAAPVAASEQQVLQTIERFFTALQQRDGPAIGKLLLADGELIGYRRENGERRISRLSHADYAAAISEGDSKLLERIWDPVIHVDGDLASAWTPYDFWVDGEFHHCGVNSFNLLRTSNGWRIAAVVYTIETEDCPPSPLGPLHSD
jgi:Putative lumazine-binding